MAYLNCYLRTFILNVLSVVLYGEKIVYWDPDSILDSRTTRSHIEVPSCGTLLVFNEHGVQHLKEKELKHRLRTNNHFNDFKFDVVSASTARHRDSHFIEIEIYVIS